MIKIIGLTGPSGAGKTRLCAIAKGYGIKSIDTDAVYHSLLVPPSPCLDELVREFGAEILLPDGTLSRPALSSIVFDEKDTAKTKLARLGEITHKYVLDRAREIINTANNKGETAIIVDAPALYESGFDKECDFVICLLADPSLRLERIIDRDSISKERADARINGQKSDDFYSSRADYTITNNCSIEQLRIELERILSNRGLI
jgi:dephospho-CoA kinase